MPANKTAKSARAAFVKALRAHAAAQPDRGETKLFGSSSGSYSLKDVAHEIEKGTRTGDKFYADLKDVLKFDPPKP